MLPLNTVGPACLVCFGTDVDAFSHPRSGQDDRDVHAGLVLYDGGGHHRAVAQGGRGPDRGGCVGGLVG